MQKILFILLLAVAGHPLHAAIRILSLTLAGPDSCAAGITVEATGSAGPFRVQVLGQDGFQIERTMSGPTETFAGLCAGVYTVLVYNRLGCARALSADVHAQTPAAVGIKPGTVPPAAALPGSGFALRAQPNPFSADFQLQVLWDRPLSETVHIEIFNALGQLIHTRPLQAVPGINPVPIHLPGAGGLLHVTARDAAGRKAAVRVLQVRE